MIVDQVCEKMKELTNIEALKIINFDSLNKDDQENLEKSMIDMMIQVKSTPIELGEGIPKNLYNEVDAKQKWALSTEQKNQGDHPSIDNARFGKDTYVYSPERFCK